MSMPIFPLNDEKHALNVLLREAAITPELRARSVKRATQMVIDIRAHGEASMMELFLGEYGLSTDEGVALMCLAEALLRVPDGDTMDELIEDKIAPSEWGQHLGKSHSSLVNASTWALFLTGKVLDESDATPSIGRTLRGAIKRLGEPVIRQAVSSVMREMGNQFVLGENIEKATTRAKKKERKGFTYSYDMLGEAAKTEKDAQRYFDAYAQAIKTIGVNAKAANIRENPGISIKLSALYPRYETLKQDDVITHLVPRLHALALMAMEAGIGLNVDAEEAGRLSLSLQVIEAALSDDVFSNWQGFGVVVQAYGLRAPLVIDWLYDLAGKYNRKIMLRLVKGAYWDTEIKHAQVEGHDHFPVFTRKSSTDVSYIACAKKLLSMTDRIYPQFATHNAHTVATILEMATDKQAFEFQRLHGMGEALHDRLVEAENVHCRIYAPVGRHKDLLAYLVRRLLENGANSSFVNQLVDEDVPPAAIAADPFEAVETYLHAPENPAIRQPRALFGADRANSNGWDLEDPQILRHIEAGLREHAEKHWQYTATGQEIRKVHSPATGKLIGEVAFFSAEQAEQAIKDVEPWTRADASARADILRKVADLYEENTMPLFSLLVREAGKTINDCVAEIREAVDFLRYYANQAESQPAAPLGIVTCISPWNLPLAIFTGQIAAALAMGNGVLAKPAEATSLIASFATKLIHQAGVPEASLKLIPGEGAIVGSLLVSDARIDGVCFTGSTATAQRINRAMAANLAPFAPLVAETGGLNAMIVDSTALPEQAIRDVLASAFQSAGQRCSALRVLYLQQDIAEPFLTMLYGAMDALAIGNPEALSTDIGPVIDGAAQQKILAHIQIAEGEGRLLHRIDVPKEGYFVPPCVLKIAGIGNLAEEIFGPVLHVATYKAHELEAVIDTINDKGFGLTFGFHSRIDDRVDIAASKIKAGNIYINRNQIGAVVESQPFGGEGLSGTGPKAGGPKYVNRFAKITPQLIENKETSFILESTLEDQFAALEKKAKNNPIERKKPREMIGPTGESNQYFTAPKGRVLCLGPSEVLAREQAQQAEAMGCLAVVVSGRIEPDILTSLRDLDAVIYFGDDTKAYREALAARTGAIVPLYSDLAFGQWLVNERHICIDTTAAGGNATLLGS